MAGRLRQMLHRGHHERIIGAAQPSAALALSLSGRIWSVASIICAQGGSCRSIEPGSRSFEKRVRPCTNWGTQAAAGEKIPKIIRTHETTRPRHGTHKKQGWTGWTWEEQQPPTANREYLELLWEPLWGSGSYPAASPRPNANHCLQP